MNTYDFSEIYEIGGPLIKEGIKFEIAMGKCSHRQNKHEHEHEHEHEQEHEQEHEHFDECVNYLLCLNDDNFFELCTKLSDFNNFTSNYTYSEHIRAILSNVNLINRCTAISTVPLITALFVLHQLINTNNITQYYFTFESCKLLHEHKYNILHILSISYKSGINYVIIKYIIDNLSEIDMFNVLEDTRYCGIIIDRIHNNNNKFLSSMSKILITKNGVQI
jgi:predicted transcriptional regulator